MALLWFDTIALLLHQLRVKTNFINYWRLAPLAGVFLLSIVRLVLPLELPFACIVESARILPAIQDFLRMQMNGTVKTLLWVLYGLAALAFLVRLAVDVLKTEKLLYRTKALPQPALRTDLLPADIAGRLLVCPNTTVPCLCGLVRPQVLLPGYAADLSAAQLRYIVLHEWQHYRNGDLYIKVTLRALASALWFNPLNRMLLDDVDQMLELRCDEQVTSCLTPLEQLDYMQTLLHAARQCKAPCTGTAAPLLQSNATALLEQRIQYLLAEKHTVPLWRRVCLWLLLVAIFCGSYCFIIQPATEAPPVENEIIFNKENTYVVQHEDGYTLYHDTGKDFEISEESALQLQEDEGIIIIDQRTQSEDQL